MWLYAAVPLLGFLAEEGISEAALDVASVSEVGGGPRP
jgi:hypothetical protein